MKTKSLSSLFLLATCLLFSIHQVTAQVFGDVSLPENTFTLGDFLDVYYQFNDDNTFTMAIRCNRPNQYFGLGLGTAMAGADIWAFQIISSEVTVNDYYATRATTPTLDTRRNGNDDLTRLGYEITSEYTLVKFTRALDTGDANDHALAPGLTNFIYATGNSPTLAYHGSSRTNRGEAQIELLDSTGEAPVEEENSSEITPVTFGDVTPLPNTTPVGDFLMFSYEFNDDNTITMVINCTIPNQFFGFGLGTSMIGADIWVFEIINSEVVASDYTSNEQGPPILDTDNQGENDLETLGYEINPSYTLIKIRRSLSTGDSNDLEILPGPTDVIFATAPYQTLAYHDGQRGIAQINLIRDTPVEEEEEDEPQEAEEEATETEEPQEEEEEATRDEEPTGTEEEPIETNDPQEEETTGDNGSNITFGDVSAPQNSVNVGDFLTINYEMNDDDSVTMLIRCSIPNQFFGLGFGESMRDSDIWLFQIVNSEVTVEDCYSNDYVPPILDTEAENPGNSDLVRLGYEITPTYTLVKVRRALNTNDAHDKVIRLGRNYVIYATTDSPTVDYHGDRRGSTSIILLENPSDSGEPNDVEDITTEDDTPGKWGDTELPQDFFNVAGLLTIYFEFTRDGYITIALRCNSPNQFFGIGFGSVMTGTDMWVFEINDEGVTATDYKGLTEGPPTRDTDLGGKQDLELLGFEVASTHTLVKVRRLLDTGDANDFILYEGWVDMIYATAPTRFLSKHPSGDRGMVTVPFIEGTKGYTLLDASSDPRDIHGILNIIAWGVLVDIGIIAARVLRGRKFTFGSIIISAQLIHSAIMWLVFIMSMTVTGMMLNKNRSVRGSKLTEDTVENFQLINTHFILGLLLMFLSLMTVVVGVANMLYLRSYQKAPPAGFNIKKMHKVLGFLMYAGAKANIIIGAIFHNDGAWMIPVYIYLFVLLVIHVFIQKKYKDGFRFSNKVRSITQKASRKPRHVALMAAINNGSPREKLLLEFPHIKWVQVGNKVYDLTDWTHPGGNYIIQACTGREVGRFLYGNYALESANFKPHKHSTLALSQLNHFYIGEVNNYESILLSKNGTHETFSRVTHDWRIASRKPVSDTVTQVNFVNNEIKVKNFGASLTWLGRHFQVSFAKKNSHTRLYTIALSLNEANIALRRNLYQYFDDIMAGEDACFEFDSSYLDPQDTLPIFIKNYYQVNGLSRAIHAAEIESPNCNFRIEGPISRGMELGHANSGTQTIICAGTGLLPFVDFLNFFLWKNMYDLIKRKAGKGKAQEMNILNIPFENYMNGLRINFIGSFANESEILGLDIIKKLAEISTKYETFNFNAMIKGYSDENIIEVKESFNTEFLRKHVSLTEERFYVVGPPRLNKQVPDSLVKIGVSQERIILV